MSAASTAWSVSLTVASQLPQSQQMDQYLILWAALAGSCALVKLNVLTSGAKFDVIRPHHAKHFLYTIGVFTDHCETKLAISKLPRKYASFEVPANGCRCPCGHRWNSKAAVSSLTTTPGLSDIRAQDKKQSNVVSISHTVPAASGKHHAGTHRTGTYLDGDNH